MSLQGHSDEAIREAHLAGLPLVNSSPRVMTEVRSIAAGLAKSKQPAHIGGGPRIALALIKAGTRKKNNKIR